MTSLRKNLLLEIMPLSLIPTILVCVSFCHLHFVAELLQEIDEEDNHTDINPCAVKKNSNGLIVVDEKFMGGCLLEYTSTYLDLFLLKCQEQHLAIEMHKILTSI